MRMRAVLLTRLAPLHAPELAGAPRPIESALRARRQGFGTLVLYLHSHRLFLAPHMAMLSTKKYKTSSPGKSFPVSRKVAPGE